MSKIFEIIHRDAAARIGKLVLDKELSTPAIIQIHEKDCPVIDPGSLWKKTALHELDTKKIVILPHRSLPLHTREDIIKELQDSPAGAQPAPDMAHTGLVIHPFHQRLIEADMYVLGAARQLEKRPREFVNSIIRLKENTRADSLLYAPALATPENLSMLVYIGVDIVDETLPVIKGYQDIYLTNSGEHHLDRLREFPCVCSVCSANTPQEFMKLPKKERSELLSHHNSLKLGEEMRNVREHIRGGHLREYVERQCRAHPWLTAALRFIDAEYTFLEKRTPILRSDTLYANTSESLNRVEIKRFAKRVMERYTAPDLDTLVLLPCSAKKPYSTSLSHQKFINAMGKYRRYVHEVIITSPLGIVPRELELMYPAAHYDTPVTGYWDMEERAWVTACLRSYLIKNRYKNIVAHVHGAYREICESVERELGIDFIYTADDGVTSRASLDKLQKAISELESVKKRSGEMAKLDIMRTLADYQFGRGAGNMLVNGAAVKAPFPRFQLFTDKQLATLIPQYGTIALTLEGGLQLCDHPYYRVKIGDFIPHSSILAPGVLDADPQIRPNDEVIVQGERFFGVGRALMSGWEMKQCAKGMAVELRHSRKIG
ncbi:tRNA-guanine transglycosylase [Candidatus Methanoperedens nitroreducens]|uniref:tRNA-guanine transglycosylase n=1 Tax=Candidatus Methanoperedens nitratireducens TaxID=1392998 RepID=A0A062V710_9EURY|nr:archaeosine synthase subunit alpha [Candidatus Methanoperedens nitroreducens]KCZ72358.1 tRNA-guanine transglycosylase [Candidatus Methanoperedens nitroreducens]MDJ1423708.1 archaeosine synthase subunit alpha [Candidatus Methanoperedens sp.]